MSYSKYSGIGRVQSNEIRQVNGLDVCTIKVPVNAWEPPKPGESEGSETTIWCELSAFYDANKDRFNTAQSWNEKFPVGTIVVIEGTPVLRPYLRANNEPDAGMRLKRATISKVMGQSQEAALAGVGAGNQLSDIPF